LLLVLARVGDEPARRLVARWSEQDARLVTARDLSRPGWVTGDVEASRATAVVGGDRVSESDIGGVLVRTPAIRPEDLPHVVHDDRQYCAAEMTAFLAWWLATLRCRVVNRPTPTLLSGPDWRDTTWRAIASSLGISFAPLRRSAPAGRVPTADAHDPASIVPVTVVVTVVAGRSVHRAPAAAAAQARDLARAADADALTVRFRGKGAELEFVDADPWVDVDDPAVADALLEVLLADPGSVP